MTAETFAELRDLRAAADAVIAAWESGDLAAAVRELAAVRGEPDTEPTSAQLDALNMESTASYRAAMRDAGRGGLLR